MNHPLQTGIDRSQPPALKPHSKINLPDPLQVKSDNGWPVYVFHHPDYEVTQIDWIFAAGSCESEHFLIPSAMHELIDDGTKNYNSFSIAELFESHGAMFFTECNHAFSVLSLIGLTKHIGKLLPVVNDILLNPSFPEHELKIYAERQAQKTEVERKKVQYLARKKFNQLLFGENSVFGFDESPDDFRKLTRDGIEDFHRSVFLKKAMAVTVSGKADDRTLKNILALLPDVKGFVNHTSRPPYTTSTEKKAHIEIADALQTAIRIGRTFPDRVHPDYFPFSILQAVLGGYFGSRLMSNLREDKGYTYGINSVLHALPGVSIFYIVTEAGKQVKDAAISEIFSEMQKLRCESLPEDELVLVKNYLYGHFLRTIDGPFQLAKVFKNLLVSNLDFNYYRNYLNYLESVQPETLLEMANKYLQADDYHQVTVG